MRLRHTTTSPTSSTPTQKTKSRSHGAPATRTYVGTNEQINWPKKQGTDSAKPPTHTPTHEPGGKPKQQQASHGGKNGNTPKLGGYATANRLPPTTSPTNSFSRTPREVFGRLIQSRTNHNYTGEYKRRPPPRRLCVPLRRGNSNKRTRNSSLHPNTQPQEEQPTRSFQRPLAPRHTWHEERNSRPNRVPPRNTGIHTKRTPPQEAPNTDIRT